MGISENLDWGRVPDALMLFFPCTWKILFREKKQKQKQKQKQTQKNNS